MGSARGRTIRGPAAWGGGAGGGTPGPPGPAGASAGVLPYVGTWDVGTAYAQDDVVTAGDPADYAAVTIGGYDDTFYAGAAIYRATAATTGDDPLDGAPWTEITTPIVMWGTDHPVNTPTLIIPAPAGSVYLLSGSMTGDEAWICAPVFWGTWYSVDYSTVDNGPYALPGLYGASLTSAASGDVDGFVTATRDGAGDGSARFSRTAIRDGAGDGAAETTSAARRSGTGAGNASATTVARIEDTAVGQANASVAANHHTTGEARLDLIARGDVAYVNIGTDVGSSMVLPLFRLFNRTGIDGSDTIADPAGGLVIDIEARAAIVAILDLLRTWGALDT